MASKYLGHALAKKMIRTSSCFVIAGFACALAHANPAFQNAGFEDIVVSPGGFRQAPPNPHWSFTNVSDAASGVANGVGSWGSGANSGTKYAYIQRGAQINQTVGGFVVGRQYQLRFAMTRRNGDVGANDANRIAVQLNGTTINTYDTIADPRWRTFRTNTFTATATSLNFRWQGLLSNSDRTSLIDDARIVTPEARTGNITDSDFETVNYDNGNWSYAGVDFLVGSDWQFANFATDQGAGVATAGSPWGGSAVSGRHFGFVQRAGIMSQELTNLDVGKTYFIRFAHNRRNSAGHQLRVRINGTDILGPTAAPSTWTTRTTGTFTATSSTMRLSFEGIATGNDVTSLIDRVEVVPEPMSLLGLGIGLVALAKRRARR